MQVVTTDVVIFQATPAGIAAAIAAARQGARVVLVERSDHLGGMMVNGVSVADVQTRGIVGGIAREFFQRVRQHYALTYGANSPQVALCSDGFQYEPSVAQQIFEAMVLQEPITVLRRQRLVRVIRNRERVASIVVEEAGSGRASELQAAAFVDASYEGDLAAQAGAPFRVGREARWETREPYAGVIYMHPVTKRVYPGSTGEGDDRIQAYCYRLCLTNRPDLRVPPPRPASYDRREYVALLDDLQRGALTRFAGQGPQPGVISYVRLPNGKVDANNNPAASVSLDLPEENAIWPNGSEADRAAFARRLRDYTLGLLWFCQNDPELPEAFRAEAQEWGLPRDEYPDAGNFPRQVYVREARRILGEYLFSAHDCICPPESDRPPSHADSIAAAHFMIDCHATRKREPDRPTHEGFLMLRLLTEPFQIPYRVMVPQRVEGLLVPVACSATHLGFCALRMEAGWMAMGQAAGTAAAMMAREGHSARSLPIDRLQRRLLRAGATIAWVEDIDPSAPWWAGVQFGAVRGFFPGTRARPDAAVTRAQAAIWFDRVAPEPADAPGAPPFRDLAPDDPAAGAVARLRGRGAFDGEEPPDEFRSAELLTFGELDRWLHCVLGARLASVSLTPGARPYVLRGELCQALFEASGGAGR